MASSAGPNTFIPPPPGLNYIEALKPSVNMLMIGSIWSAILVPLLFALFFFSTSDLRRKPIFILNVLSILLGISMGILNGVLEVDAILNPLQPRGASAFIAFGTIVITIPIVVESILVLRLVAVYPPKRMSLPMSCGIYIPLFLIKVARVVNATVFLVEYSRLTRGVSNPISAGQTSWQTQPGQKIEWTLQVIDNTATSCLFLYRLHRGQKLGSASGRVDTRSRYSSYSRRLKGLIWISASNFVFPVILSLCQLIFLYRDSDYLKGTYIFLCNDYVEIIGVLLATVWSASSHWADSNTTSLSTNPSLPAMRFGSANSSTLAGSRGGVGITTHTHTTTDFDNRDAVVLHGIRPGQSMEKMVFSLPAAEGQVAKPL